jgi:hypothetical protein
MVETVPAALQHSQAGKLLARSNVKPSIRAQGDFVVPTTPEQAAARGHQQVQMRVKVIK